MRILLDTHTLLWWLIKSPLLPTSVQNLMERPDRVVFVSAVSGWEMATKLRLGKLNIAADVVQNFMVHLANERFEVLSVSVQNGIAAGLLPGPHKDPFDRMLIAQALAENIPIVSNDRALDGYGVNRLW